MAYRYQDGCQVTLNNFAKIAHHGINVYIAMHYFSRRNDVISSVREAAQVALKQIGGDEANTAMHMTKVLAAEIRILTE